jgi:hypothetical protein
LTTRESSSFSRSNLCRTLWSNDFRENTNSNCETWGYRGGESAHMPRCFFSEQHGVTSHTTVVFQLIPVTHSRKRYPVSISQKLPVGYMNTLAKLCGVKRVHWPRIPQPVNSLSGRTPITVHSRTPITFHSRTPITFHTRTPITVHSRTYCSKRLFRVIYKHLHVNDRPMFKHMDNILSDHYRLWRPLGPLILYMVTADLTCQFRVEQRQQLTNHNVQIKYWPWMSRPDVSHSTCFLLVI